MGVDLPDGYAGLLLALLWDHQQEVVYVPGRVVSRAAEGYRGEGKTDAKDARVIADQAGCGTTSWCWVHPRSWSSGCGCWSADVATWSPIGSGP